MVIMTISPHHTAPWIGNIAPCPVTYHSEIGEELNIWCLTLCFGWCVKESTVYDKLPGLGLSEIGQISVMGFGQIINSAAR
jgi:hypothetical protein